MSSKQDPQKILESLKSTKTEANRLKSSIVQFERTSQRKSNSIERLFEAGKKKVEDVTAELKTKFSKESSDLKTAAKTEKDAIDAIRRDAKRDYNRFSRTYRAARNKRTGVEARHSKIVALSDDASSRVNEISKNETKARNNTNKISDLLTSARGNEKVISTIHDDAQKISEEIKNTYAITLDTGMAGTLVERRNELKKRTRLWETIYLCSVGAIVLAILVALLVSRPDTFVEVITERLVFVTPLLVVSFVLARQFSHERKLFEEYAFKAAAAQSLRGYTVLLNDEFRDITDLREEVLRFTIGAMEDIYDREPLVQNPSTFHLMFGNKLAKFEAKIEEKVQKVATETAKAVVKESKEIKSSSSDLSTDNTTEST